MPLALQDPMKIARERYIQNLFKKRKKRKKGKEALKLLISYK